MIGNEAVYGWHHPGVWHKISTKITNTIRKLCGPGHDSNREPPEYKTRRAPAKPTGSLSPFLRTIVYHSTLYKPPQSKQRFHKRSISSGYVWRQVVITITPTFISILSVTFQQRASAPLGINYTFVLAGASSSLAQIFFQSNLSQRMKMMRDGLAVEIQRSLKTQHGFYSHSSLLNAEVWSQHTATSNPLMSKGN